MNQDIDKEWQYLTDDEINLFDIKIQSLYRRKIKRTINFVICPLYMYAVKHGYDDTSFLKEETIHGMVEALKIFYNQKGIDREEKIKIIRNSTLGR